MIVKRILAAIALLGCTAVVVWFLFGREQPVALVDLVASPSPPVAPDPKTKPLVLRGLLTHFDEKGNAMRRARNDVARRHKEAIALWRAGAATLREVERLEQLLWVARARVGEIDDQTMHENLARLFAREAKRLKLLHESGLAGADKVARAKLYVARERQLAGMPLEDPAGRDYETIRAAYLAEFKRRHEVLIDSGLGHREHFKLEWKDLQAEFPPVEATSKNGG